MTDDGDGAGRATAAETLAARMLARVPALTDALVRTIQQDNPHYRTLDVVPVDDLWRSCHDNITRVLQLIADGSADGTDGRFDAARATGTRRAEQRMPLDDVLRSFRQGGRLVWEALIEQAHADHVDPDGMLDVATRVWEVVDQTSAQAAAAYHATERDLVRADDQRRATLWEGLLHGRAKDMAFAYEASRMIGVPVDGPYAVVVIDGPTDEHVPRLPGTDLVASAWQLRANTLVGLLALRSTTVDNVLATLRSRVTAPAGLSLVVRGLSESDVAYRQAALARRTTLPGKVEVAALHERLPEALLLGSPELAEQLVRRWLGDLLRVPAAERRVLLGTLEIWVATGGSVRHTATAANCHRNTVINRLQRMQSLTGHDFADPSCQVELALALRACALVPDLLTEPPSRT
jgi:hypothetical protein